MAAIQATADDVLELDVEAGTALPTKPVAFRIPVYDRGPEPGTFVATGEKETFLLHRPKVSVGLSLIGLMDEDLGETMGMLKAGARIAEALWGIASYVQEEDPEPSTLPRDDDGPAVLNPNGGRLRGKARLFQRLHSPNDPLDIIDLAQLFETAVRKMFERPTSSSPESLASSGGEGGTDSAAGTPEPPAATS